METNNQPNKVIEFNVGGQCFSTTTDSLQLINNTFFSSFLNPNIGHIKDKDGRYFIDRDPKYFPYILNYLRTRHIDIGNANLKQILVEAEYYSIGPLVKKIRACIESCKLKCGSILYLGKLYNKNKLKKPIVDLSGASPPDEKANITFIIGNYRWVAVSRQFYFTCHRLLDTNEWEHYFTSPILSDPITNIIMNVKFTTSPNTKLVAVCTNNLVKIWSLLSGDLMASYSLECSSNGLFFTERQLIVIHLFGKISCWNLITQQWQFQNLPPISCYSMTGNNLLLGFHDGYIKYVDMDKFPLRLKDNDILVATLYKDVEGSAITALSFMFTARNSNNNGWIEIAYGTSSGAVRIVLQHPETPFSNPILYTTLEVHSSPVIKVVLGEHHLISVCKDQNHVRTWNLSRFRGKLATQPGPMPLSSFNVVSYVDDNPSVEIGPFCEHENESIFLHRISPESDSILVRLASTGRKICVIQSITNSQLTAINVNECEGSRRIGSRSRRYLFCGHSNGDVHIWDLTTIIELSNNKHITLSPSVPSSNHVKFTESEFRHYPFIERDFESASELINHLEGYDFDFRDNSTLSLNSGFSQFTLNQYDSNTNTNNANNSNLDN